MVEEVAGEVELLNWLCHGKERSSRCACCCICCACALVLRPGKPGFLPGLVSWGSVRESISGAQEAGQGAAAPLLLQAWMEERETVFLP